MKYEYIFHFVLCASVTAFAQIPNKNPGVDRVFLKQLFRPQLELMFQYSLDSCRNLGVELNFTEAIGNLNVCIDKKLMPRVIGRTPAYFDRMRLTLAKLPSMENIEDFVPWKEELDRMCDIIPDFFNCFLLEFSTWINGCWDAYHRSTYGYLNNLSRRLCIFQRGIRSLFKPEYLPCLDKYTKSVKHCVVQSHVHFGSLCGLIPCLQQFVPKCGIPKVDSLLSMIFTTSQTHSDCSRVPYMFPSETTATPPPAEINVDESGTDQIFQAFGNSSGDIGSEDSSDTLDKTLDDRSNAPSPAAARKVEGVGTLIWGLILLVAIREISAAIHT